MAGLLRLRKAQAPKSLCYLTVLASVASTPYEYETFFNRTSCIGFIPTHVSRSGDSSGLAFRMDQGSEYGCRITNITGGGRGESLGVNIEITEGEFDESAQVDESKSAPATPDARTLLWILAVIIIGCILWAAFK